MKGTSIAVVIAALAFPALAGAASKPSLRFLKLTPPRVHGTNFKAGERVTVTLLAGNTRRGLAVHASPTGAFTVDFMALPEADSCDGAVSIAAVGARGDRANYRFTLAACPSPSATETGSDKLLPSPPYTK